MNIFGSIMLVAAKSIVGFGLIVLHSWIQPEKDQNYMCSGHIQTSLSLFSK
jgi:hypothetical protein